MGAITVGAPREEFCVSKIRNTPSAQAQRSRTQTMASISTEDLPQLCSGEAPRLPESSRSGGGCFISLTILAEDNLPLMPDESARLADLNGLSAGPVRLVESSRDVHQAGEGGKTEPNKTVTA